MTELKTLKELEKHLFVDEANIVNHMATEVSKGDLEPVILENPKDRSAVLTKDLRKEVIKWIKHFNSNEGGFTKDVAWIRFTDSGYDEYTRHAYGNVIEWIKHFFNITEEDLK